MAPVAEVAKAFDRARKGEEVQPIHANLLVKGGGLQRFLLHPALRGDVGEGVICIAQEVESAEEVPSVDHEDFNAVLDKVSLSVIEAAPSPSLLVDMAGKVMLWNKPAEKLSGFKKEEVLGRPLLELICGDGGDLDAVFVDTLDGQDTFGFECDLLTKDGRVVLLEMNATARFDASGEAVGVIVMAQDRSGLDDPALRNQVETLVAEELMLFETSLRPIFTIDGDGQIEAWNRKVAEITGVTEKEAAGQPVLSLGCIVEEDVQQISGALRRIYGGEATVQTELALRDLDGHEHEVEIQVHARCAPDGSVQGALVMGCHDIDLLLVQHQREAEDMARLLRGAHAPVLAVDVRGELIEWNDKVAAITGFSRQEVLGRPFLEDFVVEGVEDFEAAMVLAVLHGREDLGEFEVIIRTKSEAKAVLRMSGATFRDTAGEVAGVVACGQDLTSIRNSMREATRMAEDLQRLIETAHACIVGVDPAGNVNEWNSHIAQLSGWSKEDALGKGLVDNFILKEHQTDVADMLQQALSGEKVENVEFCLEEQEGTRRTVRLNASARLGEQGEVTGVLCVGQDVTELNRVMAEQRGIAEDLALFVETANAPIVGVSRHGLVVEWNRKAAALSGFAKDEAMGQALVEEFIRADFQDRVRAVLEKALQGEATASFKFVLVSKSGEHLELLLNATPRRDSLGDVFGVVFVGQDITELGRAMVGAQQVAEDLKRLLNTANVPIFEIDPEGQVVEWNRKVATMTGLSREEALGRNMVGTFIAENQDEVRKVLRQALEGESAENVTIHLSGKAGASRFVLLNATAKQSSEGNITGVICVGQDITEYRDLMRQHELVADDLRRLIETANAPIFGIDSKGCVTVWNRKAEQITSYPKTEVEGRSFVQEFVAKSDRKRMQDIVDAALQGQEKEHFEIVLCSKDSSEHEILLNATPRRGRDGEVIGVIGVGQDITEMNRQKQEAVRMATELQSIIHSAAAPIIAVDRNNRITEWNNRVEEMTGITSEQAAGKDLLVYVKENCTPEVARVLKEVVEERKSKANLEVLLDTTRSPDYVVLLLSCTPRLGSDGMPKGAICIGQDITEMKELDVKKSNMAAAVTHELRSPLHGIIGLSEQLISTAGDGSHKKPLTLINACARRLLDVVTNIMTLSALVQGKRTSLARDPVQIAGILEEVRLLCAAAVDKANRPLKKAEVQLVFDIPEQLPIIEADAHRCTQMLYNLVTNALKYTWQGEVHVTASADDEQQMVTLKVRDTGIGIGQAARERIFLPFEQEDQSDSRRYEGLGLGLAISHAVAEKHGGSLTVESEVGKGSSFTVTLPYQPPKLQMSAWDEMLAEDEQAEQAQQASAKANGDPIDRTSNVQQHGEVTRRHLAQLSGTGYVLVVDDDQQARHYVRDVLERMQAEVIECASSHECMSQLELNHLKPALVIVDVILSDGTQGFSLLKWLRARYGFFELPIIVISSDQSRECMLFAIEAGCNEWLNKPFTKQELLARIVLATRVIEEVASPLCASPDLSSACSEDAPEMPRSRSGSRLSVPIDARLASLSPESRDCAPVPQFLAPRSVSSGPMLPMPECEDEDKDPPSSLKSGSSSSSRAAQPADSKGPMEQNQTFHHHVFSHTAHKTGPKEDGPAVTWEQDLDIEAPDCRRSSNRSNRSSSSIIKAASPSSGDNTAVPWQPARGARYARRDSLVAKVPPEQFHQLHSLDCYRLLARILPVEAVQQLICGEVIEPEGCPNAAVLTASLQGVDDVDSTVLMDALGHFLDVLGTLSTAEGIVFFSSAELGASFLAVSGFAGTPGHEIQLVRFALAMRDRLDELRKALPPMASQASKLSLAIGVDMGKATRLVLGRLCPYVTVTGPAVRQARRLCEEAHIQATRQGFAQIFVSQLIMRRLGPVLSTLPIKPVDVQTGAPPPKMLPQQDEAEESSRIFALLQASEEFQSSSQNEGVDKDMPSSPSGPSHAKASPMAPIVFHIPESQPSGQGFASPTSQGSSAPSRPSRDWMALQMRSRHLQLENSQLAQRCQTLETRCQQLQRQRMAFQEQMEVAQRDARRFEMEMNFWRFGLAQGLQSGS